MLESALAITCVSLVATGVALIAIAGWLKTTGEDTEDMKRKQDKSLK